MKLLIVAGAFAYRNHPVYKVDIMGTVVKRSEQAKCFVYAGNILIKGFCVCYSIAF